MRSNHTETPAVTKSWHFRQGGPKTPMALVAACLGGRSLGVRLLSAVDGAPVLVLSDRHAALQTNSDPLPRLVVLPPE